MTPNSLRCALSIGAVSVFLLSACGSNESVEATSVGAVQCGGKRALSASGSTAQANALTRFVVAYELDCPGYTLDYTSSGSGAGVSEFLGDQTDFAGSDSPLSEARGEYDRAAQRCGSPAWNLPMVFGPLAITYNLDGVDGLALDGPTLGSIFNGTVATWDAPRIRALNPGRQLPAEPIRVIFRSDESGTTDNFQQYLDAASGGTWEQGAGKAFAGGVGEGARGNEGTSAAISTTPGSITYNEWSFARAQGLQIAEIITPADPEPVALSLDSVSRSIEDVRISGEGNDLVLDTDSLYAPSEPGAYPVVLVTYEIVCSSYGQSEVATAVKAFMTSALGNGQIGLEENGYIPVPEAFQRRLLDAVDAIE